MALMVATATLALLLVLAEAAVGNAVENLPDAQPTAWHEAAGLTPLLTAPPPPNPATICIIDTGVTPTPDLDITARWAYDGGTLDDVHATPDSAGHGTSVAHFAAGKVNGWGHAGAFPHGRIASVRVFPREGGAKWQDYIRAITRCDKLDPNTKVIVISIGGQQIAPHEAEELDHRIEQARDVYGQNVVVAAGNGGSELDYPARFDAAFAVAASQSDSGLCPFSARGPQVDIAAPGCGLLQTGWDGTAWEMSGTSYAAPAVAGALAALRSYVPSLSPIDAERVLLEAGRKSGAYPVLDAQAALRTVGIELPQRQPPSAPPIGSAILAGEPGASGQGRPGSTRDPRGQGTVSPAAARRTYPRPIATLETRRGQTLLRVANRPRSARVEIRVGRTRLRSSRSAYRLRSDAAHVRLRFVGVAQPSAWVRPRRLKALRSSALRTVSNLVTCETRSDPLVRGCSWLPQY